MVSLYNANDTCKIINIAVSSSARQDETRDWWWGGRSPWNTITRRTVQQAHDGCRSHSSSNDKPSVVKHTHSLSWRHYSFVQTNFCSFPTSVSTGNKQHNFLTKVIKLISAACHQLDRCVHFTHLQMSSAWKTDNATNQPSDWQSIRTTHSDRNHFVTSSFQSQTRAAPDVP